MDLLLHSRTKKQLASFLKSPGQGLLIVGIAGSGKSYLAKNIAAELLGVELAKLEGQPYYHHAEKEKGKSEISIDAIRKIQHLNGLKVASSRATKKVFLIDEADSLSTEAQNALLKILEEPSEGTVFILTSHSATSLLPTTVSRLAKLEVLPVDLETARSYFKDASPSQLESSWSLSGGAAGLLSSLLDDEQEHPMKLAVEAAKAFISAKTYQRIIQTGKIANRSDALSFLDGLSRVLTALHHSLVKSDGARQKSVLEARKAVAAATEAINKNGSVRLALLQLSVSLNL